MTKPPSPPSRFQALLNTPAANYIMLSIIVALLGGIGVDVSGVIPVHPHPEPECPDCPACPAQPAALPATAPVAPVAAPVEVAPP